MANMLHISSCLYYKHTLHCIHEHDLNVEWLGFWEFQGPVKLSEKDLKIHNNWTKILGPPGLDAHLAGYQKFWDTHVHVHDVWSETHNKSFMGFWCSYMYLKL